ncbi:MAG: hypothetical protein V3V14_13095 [Saprospiraceae bacterium]
MMVKYLILQPYYSKTYDPFDHEEEDIRNVIIIDSIMYMSSRGGCEDKTIECFKFARFNLEGGFIDANFILFFLFKDPKKYYY